MIWLNAAAVLIGLAILVTIYVGYSGDPWD